MMTAISTILGALPLLLSTGAGASGRHSIGGSVVGGMMTATFLGGVFRAAFFVIIQWVSELGHRRKHAMAAVAAQPATVGADEQGKGPAE